MCESLHSVLFVALESVIVGSMSAEQYRAATVGCSLNKVCDCFGMAISHAQQLHTKPGLCCRLYMESHWYQFSRLVKTHITSVAA